MFIKSYYYEVAITTRPDGTMQPLCGVLERPLFSSPKSALEVVLAHVAKEYEVNYGFFIREFRRIR